MKPKISLTFDDGCTKDFPNYPLLEWNDLILNCLKENNIRTIFFVYGRALNNERGIPILTKWSRDGHLIANHTYSHVSYDNCDTTFEDYKQDFLKNDSFISQFKTYSKLFRFPYLDEGDTLIKTDDFRSFLKQHNYRNGQVTIDASDWAVNERLVERLVYSPNIQIEYYKKFYLQNTMERANYYNNLAIKLTGRQISHTLLLHHNLTSALFLGDMIKMFKNNGWLVCNADQSYMDPIYNQSPRYVPTGKSLIWALAKENDHLKYFLRYPPEGGFYERRYLKRAN